jgi:hypothetical protein
MYYLLSSEQGPRLCLGEVFGTVIVFFLQRALHGIQATVILRLLMPISPRATRARELQIHTFCDREGGYHLKAKREATTDAYNLQGTNHRPPPESCGLSPWVRLEVQQTSWRFSLSIVFNR